MWFASNKCKIIKNPTTKPSASLHVIKTNKQFLNKNKFIKKKNDEFLLLNFVYSNVKSENPLLHK